MDISELDLVWLAGYLEGEGSFLAASPSSPGNPGISVCSTDEDVIARVARLFGTSYCEVKRKKKRWKRTWLVKKRGYHAVQLMIRLQPSMGTRRQSQIARAVATYDPSKSHRLTDTEIWEVRKLCRTNLRQAEIGRRFGITRETVNKIKNYKGPYKFATVV